MTDSTIIYTHTDEAPALATYSFLPVVQAYASTAGVTVETRDISLAGRIIASFPERLEAGQRIDDALAELGDAGQDPRGQHHQAAERLGLQPAAQGGDRRAAAPRLRAARTIRTTRRPTRTGTVRARYDKVMGSAVNPVLRQGNSDRRAPASVKNYAKAHPHRMGAWTSDSRTNVAHMEAGDFRSTEQSAVIAEADSLRIELVSADGSTTVLRESVPVLAGEVVDASVMRVAALRDVPGRADRPGQGRGRAVLGAPQGHDDEDLRPDHLRPRRCGPSSRRRSPGTATSLAAAGLSPNDGLGAIFKGLDSLPEGAEIRASFDAELADGPTLAMVDSDRGITNLHVPSDVIVDASMPAMIRTSGHMWGPDGKEADTLAVIPDSSYAGVYQVVIDDCRAHGAYDPATMGSVPNVGLMAQAAEEYGSHDKTFEIPADGTVRVVDEAGHVVLEQPVAAGDVFRMCQTKDVPIRDWVKLAVNRARATGDPAVFWLDEDRAHDANLIAKVTDLPARARHRGAADRDHGPGAGHRVLPGAHPPRREHHLGHRERPARLPDRPLPDPGTRHERQDALRRPADQRRRPVRDGRRGLRAQARPAAAQGELPALGQPRRIPRPGRELRAPGADARATRRAQVLADTLDRATGTFLNEDKSPTRRLGGIDNRGSHFYLALYWAQELAKQTDDPQLAEAFAGLAKTLSEQEQAIVDELIAVQGSPADIGGYYQPDPALAAAVMRPSTIFNEALATLS